MGLENLFFGIGTIMLIKIVWEDLKNRMIDSRSSSVMFGIVMSLFYLAGNYIFLLYYSLCVVIILKYYKKYLKPKLEGLIYLGEGDVSVLTWVIAGLLIINWILAPIFLLIYLVINLIQTYIVKEKYAGTISIFISFVLTWVISHYITIL